MKKSTNTRRNFLRNTAIAGVSLGIAPTVLKGEATKTPKPVQQDCPTTTEDYYGTGPFYTANAPTLSNGLLAEESAEGERIIISGRVLNLGCTEFIPNTEVDIWQANNDGAYDNQGYNLRGKVFTNAQGFYLFETIKPGFYLNGSQYRPAHIHIKITPPNHPTVTTQLYFAGDPYIENDAAASITSGTFDASNRIINLVPNTDGKLEGTWDIIIDGDGITTSDDLHLEQGMIYQLSPNPFTEQLTIKYGVFRPANVTLSVYDLQGRLVANLDEQQLGAEKYEAVWQPPSSLANGHYFITLKLNDLQVHYQKVTYLKGGGSYGN